MSDEINRRNAESFWQQLRDLDKMVREQQLVLEKFSAVVADYDKRIGLLEQIEYIRRIEAMGRGPTEK